LGRAFSQPGVGEALIAGTGCGYVMLLHNFDPEPPTSRER
jgi:hypothetical protein